MNDTVEQLGAAKTLMACTTKCIDDEFRAVVVEFEGDRGVAIWSQDGFLSRGRARRAAQAKILNLIAQPTT